MTQLSLVLFRKLTHEIRQHLWNLKVRYRVQSVVNLHRLFLRDGGEYEIMNFSA
jgi:hypothetical protein